MRLLFQHFDGAIQPAQLIHQSIVFGLSSHPDTPLGQRLNLIELLLASLRDTAHKRPIEGVDLPGQLLSCGIAEWNIFRLDVCIPASCEQLRVDPDLVVKPVQRKFREDHSN